jgi:hypothetical protein
MVPKVLPMESTESLLTGDTATAHTADTGATTPDAPAAQDAPAAATAAADTADATKAEGAADESKPEDVPKGAPESYEPFKAPDGWEIDQALLADFAPTLKELNLTQEQAQKVIDFAPKLVEQTAVATTTKVLGELGMADRGDWVGKVKADKEFGGDKLAENLAIAKKAMDAFASPELRDLLIKSGMGNHPEMVRAFYRAGKAISADNYVAGGKTRTSTPFYDKSNMNP